MGKYDIIDVVGEGTYGVVYKGVDKDTGEVVALKKIRIESEDGGIPSSVIREIALLKELSHPNIVKLVNVITADQTLVFEFINQDLKNLLDASEPLGLSDAQVKVSIVIC